MRKLLLVLMIIGISTLFLAKGLFVGIGGDFSGDFYADPPTIEGAEIYGQLDLSLFTLQLPIFLYSRCNFPWVIMMSPLMYLNSILNPMCFWELT